MDAVFRDLVRLQAPDIQPGTHSIDFRRRAELADWLSDWHLIAFLGTTQLVSQVCPIERFDSPRHLFCCERTI